MAAAAPVIAAAPSKKHAPQVPEEIDALSEADLFLNYGRDQQAEDLLKEALEKTPGNIPVQLKLLSIYANRKDINKFTTIARQIKDSGDANAWQQTCALGHTVDPGNPMYGEPSGAQPAVAAAPEAGPAVKPLDMDVGFNIPMDLDITSAAPEPKAEAGTMDFDVSAYTAVPPMDLDVTGAHAPAEALLPDFDVTGGHQVEAAAPGMDFDVTGSHPNVVGAASMDFDVTGSHPNVVGAASMDFNVTGGGHPTLPPEEPAAGTGTVVLDEGMDFGAAHALAASTGMDFDLGTSPAAAPAAAPEASMDFDLSASPSAASFSMETAAPAAGGMDFDISATPATPAPDISAAAAPAMGGMDFDVSAAPAAAPAAAAPAAESSFGGMSLDFDVTGAHEIVMPQAPEEQLTSTVVMSEPMDLNLAAPSAEASAGLGGLDFNITGEKPAPGVEETQDIHSTVALGSSMDFDISAAPAADAGLSLDLNTSASVVIPSGGELAGLGGGMDFDISATQGAKAEPVVDLSGINLDVSAGEGAGIGDTVVFPAAEAQKDERWQDVQNKLELATAFLEGMGDADTARELLGEVLNEGDAQQVETARTLIQKI